MTAFLNALEELSQVMPDEHGGVAAVGVPWVIVREGGGQASVGARAGSVIEPRNFTDAGSDDSTGSDDSGSGDGRPILPHAVDLLRSSRWSMSCTQAR